MTSTTHASAPRAAHWGSATTARGSPQLVGYRSYLTFSQTQNHRGIVYPGFGMRRKTARLRLTPRLSTRQKDATAGPMVAFRSYSSRGFPIPIE